MIIRIVYSLIMSTISRQGEYDQTCQVVLPHPTGSQGGTPSTGPQRKLGKEASMYYSRQVRLMTHLINLPGFLNCLFL